MTSGWRQVSIPYEVGSVKTVLMRHIRGEATSQSPMKSGRLKHRVFVFGSNQEVSIPYEVGSVKTEGLSTVGIHMGSQSPMKSGRLKQAGRQEQATAPGLNPL